MSLLSIWETWIEVSALGLVQGCGSLGVNECTGTLSLKLKKLTQIYLTCSSNRSLESVIIFWPSLPGDKVFQGWNHSLCISASLASGGTWWLVNDSLCSSHVSCWIRPLSIAPPAFPLSFLLAMVTTASPLLHLFLSHSLWLKQTSTVKSLLVL